MSYPPNDHYELFAQAFRKLSKGLASLADTAESFNSKTIFGLLRSAPDLLPHIKHVRAMYKPPEESKWAIFVLWCSAGVLIYILPDDGDLVPQDGKDETYDAIIEEIQGLEESLEEERKAYEERLGYAVFPSLN